MTDIILKIAAGLLSGVISGMGIGGGVVLIPFLTLILGFDQKIAQGINLLYFIPTGITALIIHGKNKTAEIKTAAKIAGFGVFGAVGGALLAGVLSSETLRNLFAGAVIFMGCRELWTAFRKY